jgi:hypothetical protein
LVWLLGSDSGVTSAQLGVAGMIFPDEGLGMASPWEVDLATVVVGRSHTEHETGGEDTPAAADTHGSTIPDHSTDPPPGTHDPDPPMTRHACHTPLKDLSKRSVLTLTPEISSKVPDLHLILQHVARQNRETICCLDLLQLPNLLADPTQIGGRG